MPLDEVTARLAVWQKGSHVRRIICGVPGCNGLLGLATGVLPLEGKSREATVRQLRLAESDASLVPSQPQGWDSTFIWYAYCLHGYHRDDRDVWVRNKVARDRGDAGVGGRRPIDDDVLSTEYKAMMDRITDGYYIVGENPRLPCRILCDKCAGGRANRVFIPEAS